MEIRLFDLVNNKADIRDYMFIHDGKIMVNADYLYDVILDTDKVTLQQQTELFDSKEEMFKKARAFDEIAEYKHSIMSVKEISLTHATDEPFNSDMYIVHSLVDNLLDVINELERADDER